MVSGSLRRFPAVERGRYRDYMLAGRMSVCANTPNCLETRTETSPYLFQRVWKTALCRSGEYRQERRKRL